MYPPTFDDILAAREFIRPYLPVTPLVHIDSLSGLLECNYFAKLENLQPVGAFKVRGGVYLVGKSSKEVTGRGFVSASTGNHGQSIAFAGKIFQKEVIIYSPAENVNTTKVEGMRKLGAEVRLYGQDFDESRIEAEVFANANGYRFVHSANEPKLIAGVGTIALEIFDQLRNVDVLIVPAGGGSGAAGSCIVAKHLNPKLRIIAVQSERAPAMWNAWKHRTLDSFPTMTTEHEGLATRVPFELTNRIIWEMLDDFVLVGDEEIVDAIRILARHSRQVSEGAGAASLAAAIKYRDRLKGKTVVGILSGGNIPLERLASVLASPVENPVFRSV